SRCPSLAIRRRRTVMMCCCSRLPAPIVQPPSRRCAAILTPPSRWRTTCAAKPSRCSGTAPCRWNRAACWHNGTRRPAASPLAGPPGGVSALRLIVAAQRARGEAALRMVETGGGGGLGGRGDFYREFSPPPSAARHTGRPVKWIEDRREHLIATNHAR